MTKPKRGSKMTAEGHRHTHEHDQDPIELAASEATAAQRASAQCARYRIKAMDCPTEATLIRHKLMRMSGVVDLEFNLIQRVLTVYHTRDATQEFEQAIHTLGMTAEPLTESADAVAPAEPNKPWWPLALACLLALGAEVVGWVAPGNDWLPLLLALAALAICGLDTYRKGWVALKNRDININALMSIAVTGALLLRQWPEAAMVMALFSIAERIEAASLDRARKAIRGLMALTPQQAMVQQEDGAWRAVAAETVALNARVRLKPGERVALDGQVLLGQSALDQASITGESVPVDKAPGDALYAGSINQGGELEYRVTALANDSMLARMIHAVEAAQGNRAPTQRFVDQFARIYTPIVLGFAVLVALLPPLLFGLDAYLWVYRALVLLVIACPCALVVSTPVTIVSGLAAAARHGILIKGGVYLELGRHLRWLALDKTGTLTHGKPALTDVEMLDPRQGEIAPLAACLALRSDHPVSRAVAAIEVQGELPEVREFVALPGRGVKGRIGAHEYYLANHRAIHELGWCSPALESRLEGFEQQGKTTVLLADEQGVLAVFAVADGVKQSSRLAIAELHTLGVKTLMLSGDNPFTVQAIARQVGIDEARGNQLPQDKAQAIAELGAAKTGKVGMVGDGINDAPALARADIGFAMGAAGSDAAIETADVALMDDDLRKIPQFIRLSQATAAVLKQNITLALSIKLVFLVLTLIGRSTMWMAVFADMGASLLVVFNGMRLLRK